MAIFGALQQNLNNIFGMSADSGTPEILTILGNTDDMGNTDDIGH